MECCLWTALIPEWRLPQILLPRLLSVAEVAARPYEERHWYEYLARRERLQAAGYLDYLRALLLLPERPRR